MRALLLNKTFNLEQKNASELQSAHLYYERFHLGHTAINPRLTARIGQFWAETYVWCLVGHICGKISQLPKKINLGPKLAVLGQTWISTAFFQLVQSGAVRSGRHFAKMTPMDVHWCRLTSLATSSYLPEFLLMAVCSHSS